MGSDSPIQSSPHAARPLFAVYFALLGLLCLTVLGAAAPLGAWSTPFTLLVAVAKSLLIGVWFMHLRLAGGLVRLAALIGVAFLCILLGLLFLEYLTRA